MVTGIVAIPAIRNVAPVAGESHVSRLRGARSQVSRPFLQSARFCARSGDCANRRMGQRPRQATCTKRHFRSLTFIFFAAFQAIHRATVQMKRMQPTLHDFPGSGNEVSRLCSFVRSLRSDSASLRYRRDPTLDPASDRSGQGHPFVPKSSAFRASVFDASPSVSLSSTFCSAEREPQCGSGPAVNLVLQAYLSTSCVPWLLQSVLVGLHLIRPL